ncbi:MAG: hypothetical protein JXL97_11305 [Bacteroidales bacterium]|nr:hypothetical protein [Bacteroidales bacterium]
MQLPTVTQDIFEYLSKGNFISEDTANDEIRDLHRVIESNENFELLREYFSKIGFQLEKGAGFYYFSRQEKKQDLERKIEQAYKWLDILDFLKYYGSSVNSIFSQGTYFSPTKIFEQCNLNENLAEKLKKLKSQYNELNKEKPLDQINKIIELLKDETFVEIHNPYTDEYKVLASFGYLEKLFGMINISDKSLNE